MTEEKPKLHTNMKTTVSRITHLTHDAAEVAIKVPEDFKYYTGQFVMLKIENPREDENWYIIKPSHIYNSLKEAPKTIPQLAEQFKVEEKTVTTYITRLKDAVKEENGTYSAVEGAEVKDIIPPFQRAYSMGSTPTQPGEVNTMVKRDEPHGFMSKYLTQILQEGDEVTITGPHGHFYYTKGMGKNVMLIGAGSGITPLMGIIRYTADACPETKVTLLYSNKTTEDIIYKDELEQKQKENPNLKVIHTITREEWDGHTGRIETNFIKENCADLQNTLFYLCGPLKFGQAMKKLLLDELKIAPPNVKVEAYG